jgi:hypothetical protein
VAQYVAVLFDQVTGNPEGLKFHCRLVKGRTYYKLANFFNHS